MAPRTVESVNELYRDKSLYSSPDMFSPPAERLPHVIRFELTKGCGWARCTYCQGYDGVRHSIKDSDEYQDHVKGVWERIGRGSTLARNLRRIFVGGGNALEVDNRKLHEDIQFTATEFAKNTGSHPRRISLYARTPDILRQGVKGLGKLQYGKTGLDRLLNGRLPSGLDLIYWGVESGSSEVLDYVDKGCTGEEVIEAGKIIRAVPIETSVMIMPGLGGRRFHDDHVRETARALGVIQPRFLTFMGVNPSLNSRYSKRMEQEEGRNKPLTDLELAEQMIEIIARMPAFRTKVGCFNRSVDVVGHNPLNFGSFNIYNGGDKNYLVRELRRLAGWRL